MQLQGKTAYKISIKILLEPMFWLGALIFLTIVMLGNRFFLDMANSLLEGSDFLHYIASAKIVREGQGKFLYDVSVNYQAQRNIIDPELKISILTFRNLPFVTLIFLPFSFLSLLTSFRLFGLFNFFLILLTVILFKEFVTKGKVSTMYLCAIAFFFVPVIETLKNGQLSILITLLLLGVYVLFDKKKYRSAGLIASLLLIKTQFVFFLFPLFLISKNRQRFIFGFLCGILVIFLVSSFIAGPGFWLYYPRYLWETEGQEFGSRVEEFFTFYGILRYFGISSVKSLLLNFLLYGISLLFILKRNKKVGFLNSFMSSVLVGLFFSVHILLHDLALILLPTMYIFGKVFSSRKERKFILVNLLAFLLIYLFPTFSFNYPAIYFAPIIVVVGYFLLAQTSLKS